MARLDYFEFPKLLSVARHSQTDDSITAERVAYSYLSSLYVPPAAFKASSYSVPLMVFADDSDATVCSAIASDTLRSELPSSYISLANSAGSSSSTKYIALYDKTDDVVYATPSMTCVPGTYDSQRLFVLSSALSYAVHQPSYANSVLSVQLSAVAPNSAVHDGTWQSSSSYFRDTERRCSLGMVTFDGLGNIAYHVGLIPYLYGLNADVDVEVYIPIVHPSLAEQYRNKASGVRLDFRVQDGSQGWAPVLLSCSKPVRELFPMSNSFTPLASLTLAFSRNELPDLSALAPYNGESWPSFEDHNYFEYVMMPANVYSNGVHPARSPVYCAWSFPHAVVDPFPKHTLWSCVYSSDHAKIRCYTRSYYYVDLGIANSNEVCIETRSSEICLYTPSICISMPSYNVISQPEPTSWTSLMQEHLKL